MMNGEQTLGDMCLYLKSGALGEIRTHGLCLPRIGFGFSHYLHDSTTEQVVAITSSIVFCIILENSHSAADSTLFGRGYSRWRTEDCLQDQDNELASDRTSQTYKSVRKQ